MHMQTIADTQKHTRLQLKLISPIYGFVTNIYGCWWYHTSAAVLIAANAICYFIYFPSQVRSLSLNKRGRHRFFMIRQLQTLKSAFFCPSAVDCPFVCLFVCWLFWLYFDGFGFACMHSKRTNGIFHFKIVRNATNFRDAHWNSWNDFHKREHSFLLEAFSPSVSVCVCIHLSFVFLAFFLVHFHIEQNLLRFLMYCCDNLRGLQTKQQLYQQQTLKQTE